MPKGLLGQNRPTDAIGATVMKVQIATNENKDSKPTTAWRKEIAKKPAEARWA